MDEQSPQELQLFGKTVTDFHILVDALSNDKAAILRFIITEERQIAALREQRNAALAELATARRQRDAAVAALEAVVTEGIQHKGFRECWFCHAWLPEHKPDCEGQAALAQARGQ